MEREPLLPKHRTGPEIPTTNGNEDSSILPRLFSILTALEAQKLPTSNQLIVLLSSILHSDLLESTPEGTIFQPNYGTGRIGTGRLTREGEKVRIGLKGMIESLLILIQERLGGDTLQELLYHVKKSDSKLDTTSTSFPIQPQTGTRTIQSPQESIQTILFLFVTSPQLRLLVVEATTLLKDVIIEILIDRGEVGRVGVEVVDKIADKIIGDDRDLKGKMKEEQVDVNDFLAADRKPRSAEELNDTFVDRFTKILHTIQANSQYKSAVLSLINFSRIYITKVTPHLPSISLDTPNASISTLQLFVNLLEPFTGGTGSLAPLRKSIQTLMKRKDAGENQINNIFENIQQFIESTLIKEGFLGSSAFNRQLSNIHTSLVALATTDPELKVDIQTFFSHLFFAVEIIVKDEYLLRVGESTVSLLLACEQWFVLASKIAVGKQSVWGDLLEFVIPQLAKILKDLPLPRIEFSSDSLDLALDAPPFLSSSFIPDKVTCNTHTSLTLLPSTSTTPLLSPDIYSSTSTISFTGLRAETLGIGYFLRWKGPCGISFVDSGLLDLGFGRGELGGLDLSLELSKSSDDSPSKSLFQLNTSTLRIDKFTLNSHMSSHPIMNFFLLPLIRQSIKYELEAMLNQKIADLVERLGRIGWKTSEIAREEGGGLLGWCKGLWRGILEESTTSSDNRYSDESDFDEEENLEEEEPEIQLSSKGLIIELPDSEGTVGIGSEGLVIEAGTALTPLPRLSVPQAIKKEYSATLREGKKRKKVLKKDLEEIAKGVGEFSEAVERERKAEGWRSESFDW